MTSSTVIFSIPFSASMMLRMENSRLKPCSGLMRLNFGLMASPATSSFVWAKVLATANRAVTASSGPAVLTTTRVDCTSSSRTKAPSWPTSRFAA